MRNVVVCVVACCALKAVAVNAIGIVPIPSPIECKTDVTRPVALDETATVAVDCLDAPCTKAESRRLANLGKDLGVTVVPQMQVFGHASLSRSCSTKHSTLDMHPEYEPLFEPGGESLAVSVRPLTSLGTAGRPIAARFNKQGETKEKEHEDHA